ncbi:hypothetical protein [Terribacillus saccharophilus]|uniref:hypothetical protein n=1 Tax=Terribacillus saccharophilus TaxID=361277 RepID=UPI001FEEA919|nr:hypothetical protein [Terribacillus goriensis]
MEREVLKQKLAELVNNEETAAPLDDLLLSMLPYIGDPDPILRDRLIYGIAGNWITEGLVPPALMIRILEELLTERFLFKERNTQEVLQHCGLQRFYIGIKGKPFFLRL